MLLRAQLKQMSKEQLKGQWGEKALESLVMLLISLVVNAVIGLIFRTGKNSALTSATSLITSLVTTPILFGFTEGLMKTRIGENPKLDILFSKFSDFKRIAVYCVIYGVVNILVAVISSLMGRVFIIGGLLVLAISVFMVFVYVRFSMAQYILIENPYTDVASAFRQSYFLTRGRTLSIIVFYLSFIGWIILGALSFGIGMLWILPYIQMAMVNLYYDMKQDEK